MRGKRNVFKIGDPYGLLTVTEVWTEKNMNKKIKTKESVCRCLCECGREVVVYGRYLRSGHKRSCGCLARRKGNENPHWKGHGEISSTFWSSIKSGAEHGRARNIKFEITIEQAWELFIKQNRRCALTGLPLTFPTKSRRYNTYDGTASLDRIDSTKDYTIDNVQWVHKIVNLMKFDLNQDQFLRWCRRIVDHNPTIQAINEADVERPLPIRKPVLKPNPIKEERKKIILELMKDQRYPTSKDRLAEFTRQAGVGPGMYWAYRKELLQEGRL